VPVLSSRERNISLKLVSVSEISRWSKSIFGVADFLFCSGQISLV